MPGPQKRAVPLHPDMEFFLRFKKAERMSDRTLAEYRSLFQRLILSRPDLETADLEGVAGSDFLTAFVSGLTRRDGKPLDPDTSRKYYSMLGTYTSWLAARDLLVSDPAPKLPQIKRKKGRPKPVPEHDFRRLLEGAPTASDRLAILLMGRSGLRRAELREIRFKDFDLHASTVYFVGKGNKPVDQPLLEVVRLAAEAALQERRPEPHHYLQFPTYTTNPPNGPSKKYPHPERPISENAQDNWWAAMLLAADLPPRLYGMHQLRHSSGTHYYAACLDAVQTHEYMRHSKMETTFEYYVKPSDDARKRALKSADDLHQRLLSGGQS